MNNFQTSLASDIRTAILDLESVRTDSNRDKIVWAQYVLTACAELAESAMDEA